jgi:glycosyltransferase involved in cell wall biosynthesis
MVKPETNSEHPEVSIVMPCLNEADTLGTCIRKAQQALAQEGIAGEIVIADNGSTDDSRKIAESLGARVVPVPERGYGNALKGGIRSARGRYVIMGDADDSYDFLEIPRFLKLLREGYPLVQGCRLPSGGGKILPGAMPFLHRWIGNPLLTRLVRRMFYAPIHDVYCGMRGFTKELYEQLHLRSPGMEFATEMIIKAGLQGVRTAEVPITLHPDGRVSHSPHLRTFRDGWRTLRFYLLYSPKWVFWIPGWILVVLGMIGYGIALPGLTLGGVRFDAHTLLVSSLSLLLGVQSLFFAIGTKTFAVSQQLVPPDPRLDRFFRTFGLERGIFAGLASLAGGMFLVLAAFLRWKQVGFGDLPYPETMRLVIPGITLAALGFQTVLSSFFVSMIGNRGQ